ncbi:MAG: hypothetical protein FJ246_00120 [Nitrospira sp.]|nr:hypothetical protein [Nitrospira sp.]
MLTLPLFGLVALTWLAMGVTMITLPARWRARIGRVLTDPLPRFLLTQGMILGGLVLLVGSSTQEGHWLWVSVGALMVIKGMILLGASPRLRERLLGRWGRIPLWVHRLSGTVLIVLATLLAIDTLRGTP